jgi:hypothetical protein
MAWNFYKSKDWDWANKSVDNIIAPDWRHACRQWLNRREGKKALKEGKENDTLEGTRDGRSDESGI